MPLPYALFCTLVGIALSWIPTLVHGPIAAKFDLLYIRGAVAVWGWYSARMLIGFLVGITRWPARWYLRGPLCGFLMMFPLGVVAIATPGCGFTWMFLNEITGTVIGTAVAGIAYAVTGRHHLEQL